MRIAAHTRRDSFWRSVASAWTATRPAVHVETLILLGALYFALFANVAFWKAALPDHARGTWMLTLFLLVVAANGIWLSLLVWRRTARLVLTALILISAFASHYMLAYGIYLDAPMARNILNTDWREATDLMGVDMVWPVLTALPAIAATWWVRLQPRPWKRAVLARFVLVVALALMGIAGALVSLQPLTSFLRTQREVRYLVTPANVLVSVGKILSEEAPGRAKTLIPVGEDAVQSPPATQRKPRLFVLVVGETARAANWGLSGYTRQTTPELAKRDVLNFPDVTACGSSTEVSLPCMFSAIGRGNYSEKAIRRHESLLHVLNRAGVSTAWFDNQSGCKGTCNGLPFEDVRARTHPELCQGKRCYDGILLEGLGETVAQDHPGDLFVVLHMLGNHGPNYFERYPAAFQHFLPVCESSDLGRCSREEIVNAYDNALLYTDHVLATSIDLLAGMSDYDTALLYVSDHGESLGEMELYLHGMPYAIAPAEQLQVPMVAWFSKGWRRSMGLDTACLQKATEGAYSHDHLFHTLLGLSDVKTALYQPDFDLFLSCRARTATAPRATP